MAEGATNKLDTDFKNHGTLRPPVRLAASFGWGSESTDPTENPTITLFCVFFALVTQALLYDPIQRADQRPACSTRSDAALQLGEQIPPRLALPPGVEHRSQTLTVRSQCS